jgi:hypothetical protein
MCLAGAVGFLRATFFFGFFVAALRVTFFVDFVDLPRNDERDAFAPRFFDLAFFAAAMASDYAYSRTPFTIT